ncbi:MAG: hypothetical protein U0U66_06700 [Cytophagaceae bacterium]
MISLWSCKRDYKDTGYVGTAYISASENFAIATPFAVSEQTSVNFPLGINQEFTASFNESVSWEIRIVGKSSGATYTIKGVSSEVNASNATWTGRHDGINFFESGEEVEATLVVIGYKPTTTFAFTIDAGGQRNYTTGIPNLVYVPYSNFESATLFSFPYQFSISPAGVYTGPTLQDDVINAPEGTRYCRVNGKSTAANGYFVGGVQHRSVDNPYFITWDNPSEIFVNLYVRGVDNLLPNSKAFGVLNFEFHEDDDGISSDCIPPTNNSPHCPEFEDGWVYKIPINHTGWKLFSTKYSNLTPSEDAANGGSGNRVLQPNQIYRVQMGLVSNPPFNYVEAEFDFACFTLGAPFDPKTF